MFDSGSAARSHSRAPSLRSMPVFQRDRTRRLANIARGANSAGAAAIDTRRGPAHPRTVGSFLRRVASIACILAFAHSAIVECGGWQATPEARRQCCEDGACPLHHRKDDASKTQVTQSTADDCCAQSQRQESSPSGTVFASTMTLAIVQPVPPVDVTPLALVMLSAPWETPSPPRHVAKPLLFSVLVV